MATLISCGSGNDGTTINGRFKITENMSWILFTRHKIINVTLDYQRFIHVIMIFEVKLKVMSGITVKHYNLHIKYIKKIMIEAIDEWLKH